MSSCLSGRKANLIARLSFLAIFSANRSKNVLYLLNIGKIKNTKYNYRFYIKIIKVYQFNFNYFNINSLSKLSSLYNIGPSLELSSSLDSLGLAFSLFSCDEQDNEIPNTTGRLAPL